MTSAADLPARELDAAVAREVMGLVECRLWSAANLGSAGGPVVMAKCSHDPDECYPSNSVAAHHELTGPPRYSTDGSAMLAVLDALQGRGWRVSMHQYPTNRGYVEVSIAKPGREMMAETVIDKGFPRTVALAALAAVGGK